MNITLTISSATTITGKRIECDSNTQSRSNLGLPFTYLSIDTYNIKNKYMKKLEVFQILDYGVSYNDKGIIIEMLYVSNTYKRT